MATGGNEIASDEIPDFQCVSCVKRKVVKYCVDCQGYCCQSCVEDHARFPTMKKHTLLDKSNLQASGSQPAKLPEVPTERCAVHSIKILDMYCADHDEVGCTTCMALTHRSCTNVHSIPDDIDMLFKRSEINEIHHSLQDSKGVLEDIRKKKDVLLKELFDSKEEADKSIADARKEIVAAVENLETKSLKEVENVYQAKKSGIENERKEATDQADGIEKVVNCLMTSEGNKAQQFVCLKLAGKKIADVNKFQLSRKTETEAKIKFTIDPNIKTCFRNMETFGKINIKSSVKEKTEAYQVENCTDVNVKLSQDSQTCNIFSSCMTEDGSLLLVDLNNRKLKRANIKTMTVNSYLSFDTYPYSVCCTGSQEAVVTFYSSADYIQFVSLGNQLTPSRKVKISHHCLGIACKEDKLYIADNGNTLFIHDMAGNQLQAISRASSGNGLFSLSRHTTFNDNGNGIIVADYSNGVIILDGQYQHVASFSDFELSCAHGVCTDRNGNIFVCGYNSHNVLQIGYDGKKRGVVVSKSDGLNCPQSVCFDSVQCKLIVTQSNDTVKLFDLK